MKSRIVSIASSVGSFIAASCGGACGIACFAGGCCGGTVLFGFIGLSGSTLQFFETLTPVFLALTIISLSYAFYQAYKPKPVQCCEPSNVNSECGCSNTKKPSFFQSKSFLWLTTIVCAIMWTYPYISKSFTNSDADCSSNSQTIDTTRDSAFVVKRYWEQQ